MRRGRNKGVTLVELMIVLAIIVILAAVAVQGLSHVDHAASVSRQALMTLLAARRDAVAIGTQVYSSGANAGLPRVPCMPNTQVIITATEIDQYNCSLDPASTPNTLPCTTVTDDCTTAWGGAATHTLTVPSDVTLAYVQLGLNPREALGSNTARVFYRPDGTSDACTNCASVTNLGGANETLTLYFKPTSVTDESACTSEAGRCFKVVPLLKQSTHW